MHFTTIAGEAGTNDTTASKAGIAEGETSVLGEGGEATVT